MERSSKYALILSWMITIGLAWVIWRPLGAILTIMAIGNLRKIVIINSFAWESPRYPAIFGHVAGAVAAAVTQISAYFSVKSFWAFLSFTILGFIAVGYIGYGIPKNQIFQNLAHSYRLITQSAAIISYLIASTIMFAVIFVLLR